MSDDRDFSNDGIEGSILTLGTSGSSTTYSGNSFYANGSSPWCYTGNLPTKTISLKLAWKEDVNNPEFYEAVQKLMVLLKDTPWNITSTKVKT